MPIHQAVSETGLGESEIRDTLSAAFDLASVVGKRLLFVIPDSTRTCPIPLLFKTLYRLLAGRVKALDFLIALGTHPPMSEEALLRHAGIRNAAERRSEFPLARFFNHEWRNPEALRTAGVIPAEILESLSEGRLRRSVEVKVNRTVFDYDLVVILGPVFPHEVVGFSGGNKYFFPGVAGPEIIDTFHWLGALITNRVINGVKDTPVRRIIDRAASFLDFPKLCIALVVDGASLRGMFIGRPEEAFDSAADLSNRIHIRHENRPFRRILSCAPEMYDDLWTAGKCMYKLEPVAADGGELVIFAPHVREVSVTHGEILHRIGYHVRDYFLAQMDRFADIPGGVMAHSTHVKGAGTYENGIEHPRIRVTLATGIPESVCRKINLGFMDWRTVRIEEWKDREEEGVLVVPKAGEILYRLTN
jgi:lactate racemase